MTKINIEVQNSERFRRQVKEGGNDPLTDVDIHIDDIHVKGGKTYATRTLREALEAVEPIFRGEKRVIIYSNGPSYLVFEPRSHETVTVTSCGTLEAVENPEERLSVDKTGVISKESLVDALINTAKEYCDLVKEINPDLEDTKSIRQLQNEIINAESKLMSYRRK